MVSTRGPALWGPAQVAGGTNRSFPPPEVATYGRGMLLPAMDTAPVIVAVGLLLVSVLGALAIRISRS